MKLVMASSMLGRLFTEPCLSTEPAVWRQASLGSNLLYLFLLGIGQSLGFPSIIAVWQSRALT